MLHTIRHKSKGREVAVAKLLTGYLQLTAKLQSPDAWLEGHDTYDANFVSFVITWQKNRMLEADGVIGPKSWRVLAREAPTVSTAKKPTGSFALAVQLLLNSSLTADAVFGSRTKQAVAAYQSAVGLSPDGICGEKTWRGLITGEVDTAKHSTFKQPKDFKQYDSKWAGRMYSSHGDKSQTMRNSACGPSSMADIVYTVKDKTQTPWTLAQLSMQWGDRTYSSGTAWSFFTHIMKHFGFSRMIATKSLDTLKACLDAGGYAVCSMGPGYWTKGGHFICAWKYTAKYIYCNDPASGTRKRQALTDFVKQRKQFFCFYA